MYFKSKSSLPILIINTVLTVLGGEGCRGRGMTKTARQFS